MAETEHEAALLAEHAAALRDRLVDVVPGWVGGALRARAPHDADPATLQETTVRLVQLAEGETLFAIAQLLETDIDDQWTSPLEMVRSLVAPITEGLDSLGAKIVPRQPGTAELYPDDRFALTPATFADVHPDLHEPGLAWGAAKAHIHLKRHGSPAQSSDPVVVVFAPDLGDRSRFDAFAVTHVRSAGKLAEFAQSAEPDLVIVDLDRTSAPADFRIDNAHVVGFGSHVDTDRHEDALEAGFDAVMARSIFFRRLPELLEPVVKAKS